MLNPSIDTHGTNELNCYRSPRLAIAVAMAFLIPSALHAQAQQTADGAQRFLAKIAEGGAVKTTATLAEVPFSSRYQQWDRKKLQGLVQTHDKVTNDVTLLQARVVELDDLGPGGVRNPCVTTVRWVAFPNPLRTVNGSDEGSWKYETVVEVRPEAVAVPYYLDWGKATVGRSADGRSVYANAADPRFTRLWLIFESGDGEVLDRLEYAMKFLKMSCDATADTGF